MLVLLLLLLQTCFYSLTQLHILGPCAPKHHTVKKIANILHLDKNELISAKAEIESYLD